MAGLLFKGVLLVGGLWQRLGRREFLVVGAISVFAALLLGFIEMAGDVIEGDTRAFDRLVFMALRHAGDPADAVGPWWLENAAEDITSLGSIAVLGLISLLTGVYLMMKRATWAALLVTISVGGGMSLSWGLKQIFDRARPDLVPHAVEVFTASFPSGHATLSAATYLTLGAVLAAVEPKRWLKAFLVGSAIFLTVLIGLSRVYLGVHWPTDVLAGWSLGAGWATLCWLITFPLQQKSRTVG